MVAGALAGLLTGGGRTLITLRASLLWGLMVTKTA